MFTSITINEDRKLFTKGLFMKAFLLTSGCENVFILVFMLLQNQCRVIYSYKSATKVFSHFL